MATKQFSADVISRGLELLIHRFSKISIFAHILDQYFNGFIITRKTTPLSLVLTELSAHIAGQMARLCFDTAGRYETASINELYRQIISSSDFEKSQGVVHIEQFKGVADKLKQMTEAYKEKLQLYCDKHYAHVEIRSDEDAKKDYEEFKISWSEIKGLLEQSKEILFTINLFWNNADTDFADSQYEDFKRKFWNLICLPNEGSTEFWT